LTQWFVYIVRCSDNTFYTGITTNLFKRVFEHNNTKKGAKYTSTRRPVELQYYEKVVSRSAAMKREHEIKKLSREKKKELVGTYPGVIPSIYDVLVNY